MASPIITSIQEYRMVMQRIDDLMASNELSPNEVKDLRTLSMAVEVFENEIFPVGHPTSHEEAEFRVDQHAIPKE